MEGKIILSVGFSKTNKQFCETQSAYFGHKVFTLYTTIFTLHTILLKSRIQYYNYKSSPRDFSSAKLIEPERVLISERFHSRSRNC